MRDINNFSWESPKEINFQFMIVNGKAYRLEGDQWVEIDVSDFMEYDEDLDDFVINVNALEDHYRANHD